MIQIQRHIEILLLSHDCVILPGFGGFIAHHVDARYDADDRLFLPPYRTLGFNPQLTLNDSLLVQSYVEAYDMSYPDALRQIETEVDELKGILRSEGEYVMNGVGVLSVNCNGNYEFAPCESGILSPEKYGLSDYSFKRLKDAEPLSEGTPMTDEIKQGKESNDTPPALLDFADEDENAEEESHALVIKMSWVRNAVAIAAAIACFCCIRLFHHSPYCFNNYMLILLNSECNSIANMFTYNCKINLHCCCNCLLLPVGYTCSKQ